MRRGSRPVISHTGRHSGGHGTAGFDLRARLAPVDDHDGTLTAWEASLPQEERERWRAKLGGQRELAMARASS